MTTTTSAGLEPGPLRGNVRVPGDELISVVALTLGTLCRGFTVVSHCSRSPDVVAVRNVLGYAGGRVQAWIGDGTTVVVSRTDARVGAPAVAVRSPAALAYVIARFVAEGGAFDVDLPLLPALGPLIELLRASGATIACLGERITRIAGPPTVVGPIHLTTPSSFLAGALLIANTEPGRHAQLHGAVEGVDHVHRMLERFGAAVRWDEEEVDSRADDLNGAEVEVPGDTRAAAFLVAAASVVPDSRLTIEGVAINPTRMGVLDALRMLGVKIAFERMVEVGYEPIADLRVSQGALRGTTLPADVVARCGEDWPMLAAVAACAEGTTVLAGKLDDAPPIVALLRAASIDASLAPGGGLRIAGGLPSAPPETYLRGTDERLALVAAILSAHATQRSDLAATPIEAHYPGIAEVWTTVHR